MRTVGTTARGIRLPVLSKGDDLVKIVVESVLNSSKEEGFKIEENDIIGITEAIVAKTQGNYASIDDLAQEVKEKFPDGVVGVVFPILSRNRFLNILKGISKGAKKVFVLLSFPQDEVGNPITDLNTFDFFSDNNNKMYSGQQFKEKFGDYKHTFTGVNYIDLYTTCSDNIEVFVSKNPADILKLTKNVIAADIHTRNRTKKLLLEKGAEKVVKLDELLSSKNNKHGYNEDYGVLGSNLSTGEILKLFPRNCSFYVDSVQKKIFELTGKKVEVLIYGDGAFKDPACGIWELADPVVSPAYTKKLGGTPHEIKLKFIADSKFANMNMNEKTEKVKKFISDEQNKNTNSEGTTPRKYADLVGSLCDLISGSGDKGTPVVYIKGYFDNYSAE